MEDLKNKKHLFFDLDDTLWDFTRNSAAVLQIMYGEFQLENKLQTKFPDFIEKYRLHNLHLWSLFYKRQLDKNQMRNNRFHDIFKQYGYDNYEENLIFSEEYSKRGPYGTLLKEGCLDTLTYLKGKYKLHIITNGFVETQAIKMESSGLREFFTNIIISEEHSLVKPEEKIFRISEELANAQPHECVMIGDSLESDVEGALNAGWEAIYFAEDNDHDYSGRSIRNLSELKNIF